MKKSRGFTLVELLVVISIIAVLMAVLMPAMQKVRQLAMSVVCMTNGRTLGTGCLLYAQDHDDHYPLLANRKDDDQSNIGGGSNEDQPVDPWWNARIMPYLYPNVKEHYVGSGATSRLAIMENSNYILKLFFDADQFKVLYCPAIVASTLGKQNFKAIVEAESGSDYPNPFPVSYKLNAHLAGHSNEDGPWGAADQMSINANPSARAYRVTMRTSQVKNPARTFLISESSRAMCSYNDGGRIRSWTEVAPGHFIKPTGDPDFVPLPWAGGLSPSYTGKVNMVFADGHTGNFERNYTADEYNDPPSELYKKYKFYAGNNFDRPGIDDDGT